MFVCPTKNPRLPDLVHLTLAEAFVFHPPYIIADAHAAYAHWWKAQLQTYALDAAYQHLREPKTYWPRYTFQRKSWSTVSHTTTLPDGEQITWSWLATHGTNYRWKGDRFRQGHAKGVSQPGRNPNSLNRDSKTKDYRNSYRGKSFGARKAYSLNQADRSDRRRTKQLIQAEKYDQLFTHREPIDWWDFD